MLRLLIILSFLIVGVIPSTAAENGWIKASRVGSVSKKMRRKGMMPTTVSCRNSPDAKVTPRPQVFIKWKKNPTGREWAVMFNKGTLVFRPGNPSTAKQWRRMNGKKFAAGTSRTVYRCDLWYKK